MFSTVSLAAPATDSSSLHAHLGHINELCERARTAATATATALVASLLPTCSRISWSVEYENGDDGTTFATVSDVLLTFSDRVDVSFPAYEHDEGDLALHLLDGPWKEIYDRYSVVESDVDCVDTVFCVILGLDVDHLNMLRSAVDHIVRRLQDDEEVTINAGAVAFG